MKAAEAIGVSYHAFRGLLRKGMFRRVGPKIAPLVAKDSPGTNMDSKAWTWTRFNDVTVALGRLMKVLMDDGVSFRMANEIVADQELWSWFQHSLHAASRTSPPGDGYLVVWPSAAEYAFYATWKDCRDDLQAALGRADGSLVMVRLADVRAHMIKALAK
jgi:hypothetical protein